MSLIQRANPPANQSGFAPLVVIMVLAIAAVLLMLYASLHKTRPKPLQPLSQTTSSSAITSSQSTSTQAQTAILTPPSNLQAKSSNGGYNLTWNPSTSSKGILHYQVYYQGNLLAEPITTNYQHNLPPPAPSCNPITLTYLVRAVDNYGNISQPSNTVSVKYGGC